MAIASHAIDDVLKELREELMQSNPEGLDARVYSLRELLRREGVLCIPDDRTPQSASASPQNSPKHADPEAKKEALAHLSKRRASVPFHIHRNAPFLDEVTLEARHWVHFNRLCKYGHWHGTAHPAHECKLCVSSCGGGAWSRLKKRDETNKLTPNERKRLSSLLTQAMHIAVYKSKRANPYKNFDNDSCVGVLEADKIVYHVPTASFRKKTITVRIERDSFAEGAMRRCWRMIEFDDRGKNDACVAKQYFKKDAKNVASNYWIDTKMQSVAKHYAALFSRHPSCWDTIDFIEAYMIRLRGQGAREDDPLLYSVEHYLEGNYVKYNNNSGYCLSSRSTPQAFSHYTYAKSLGQLMVVDIQGVGDLYTDPQIHTANGKDFGEGNLSIAGFALFFQTHVCNHICKSMNLRQFEVFADFASSNKRGNEKARMNGGVAPEAAANRTVKKMAKDLNVVSGGSGAAGMCHDPKANDSDSVPQVGADGTVGKKMRFADMRSDARVPTSLLLNGGHIKGEFEQSSQSGITQDMLDINAPLVRNDMPSVTEVKSPVDSCLDVTSSHFDETTTNPPDDVSQTDADDLICDALPRAFSSGGVSVPDDLPVSPKVSKTHLGSSRGDIHMKLSELHALGRFTEDTPHVEASFYHLQLAAMYESIPGLLGLARMYSGLERDYLSHLVEVPAMHDLSIILLEKAFRLDSYDAACALSVLVADGNYTPVNHELSVACLRGLISGRLHKVDTNFGWRNFEVPVFKQMMSLAEHLVEMKQFQDASEAYSEAADTAMAEGRGAAATKLYMKAEEVAGMIEEEEEEEEVETN
eukprot:TRINITY_DN37487_c0_g1_i1.p1 TRINITY_DN37487_c0_g1~~TRINITY_DN37487_c0_g1_i1.p1  ORF type:complete len:824 (+),score=372.49 TRINITY_DN37487_c0_g1_i1:39-2474(+)